MSSDVIAPIPADMPVAGPSLTVELGMVPVADVRTAVVGAGILGVIEEEAVNPNNFAEKINNFETRHYVEEAPSLGDQLNDGSRTNIIPARQFKFNERAYVIGNSVVPTTEGEYIGDLVKFLNDVVAECSENDSLDIRNISSDAQTMLDHLTFIGAKELKEAVEFFGSVWKNYLREDASRQICVLTNVKNTYSNPERNDSPDDLNKSSKFIFDSILATFTDEEINELGPRIVTTIEELTSDPENTKVILLEDWAITGTQLGDLYFDTFWNELAKKYKESVELELVVSDRRRIEKGFSVGDRTLPVNAYFRAHEIEEERAERRIRKNSIITGSHSTVDFGFGVDIYEWIHLLIKQGIQVDIPKYSVNSDYKHATLENIKRLESSKQS